MPRAPSLSKDAVFWFAVIAALAFLPTLISVLSGPWPRSGGRLRGKDHVCYNNITVELRYKRASASRLHGEPARNMNAVQLDTFDAGASTCRWR